MDMLFSIEEHDEFIATDPITCKTTLFLISVIFIRITRLKFAKL